jgi:hypothetical protein
MGDAAVSRGEMMWVTTLSVAALVLGIGAVVLLRQNMP